MSDINFGALPSTAYAAVLERRQFMDMGLRELWPQTPRLFGSAFTVQLTPGDNLMFHAAIYEAPKGSVIVANAGDNEFAVAGGNVCAVTQQRGIAGFVIDGVIRDLDEIRQNKFPVFARGLMPIPGIKKKVGPLNTPIHCGGVEVFPGDIIVADEEGIAVIPQAQKEDVYKVSKAKLEKESNQSLDEWQQEHHAKITSLLNQKNSD